MFVCNEKKHANVVVVVFNWVCRCEIVAVEFSFGPFFHVSLVISFMRFDPSYAFQFLIQWDRSILENIKQLLHTVLSHRANRITSNWIHFQNNLCISKHLIATDTHSYSLRAAHFNRLVYKIRGARLWVCSCSKLFVYVYVLLW